MAKIIGCKPRIVAENQFDLTLRFRSAKQKAAFKEAVRVANLTEAQFRAEYDKENGTDPRRQAFSPD